MRPAAMPGTASHSSPRFRLGAVPSMKMRACVSHQKRSFYPKTQSKGRRPGAAELTCPTSWRVDHQRQIGNKHAILAHRNAASSQQSEVESGQKPGLANGTNCEALHLETKMCVILYLVDPFSEVLSHAPSSRRCGIPEAPTALGAERSRKPQNERTE